MALAVTHIILTIALLDIFRHYVFSKRKFPRYLLVVGGIAGLLPDIDVPLGWMLSIFSGITVDVHRIFTHSILFVPLFLILGAVFQYQYRNLKWSKIFYVIAAGWFMHLALDCLYGGSWSSILWPFSTSFSFCPGWNVYPYASGIDALILVGWLLHEEMHNYIIDYF